MSASRSSSAAPAAGAGASASDSSSEILDWAEECISAEEFVESTERCREVDASRVASAELTRPAMPAVNWSNSPVFLPDWPTTVPIFKPKTVMDICSALPVICRRFDDYEFVRDGITYRAKQCEFFFKREDQFEAWREAKLSRSEDEDHYKHAYEACSYALIALAMKLTGWTVVTQHIHTEFSNDNIVEIREVIKFQSSFGIVPCTNDVATAKSDILEAKLLKEAQAAMICDPKFVNRRFPIAWTEVRPLKSGLPVPRKKDEPITYAIRLNMRKVNEMGLIPKLTTHLALQYIQAVPAWTVSAGDKSEICRITFVYTDVDLVAYEAAEKAAKTAKNTETTRLESVLRTAKLRVEGEYERVLADENNLAQIERYEHAKAAHEAVLREFNAVRNAKIVIDMHEIVRQRLSRGAAVSRAK